jgi:peptide subunit release factor 1 (eRF1)
MLDIYIKRKIPPEAILSGETEEGQMLKNSFGGIAAILRFKLQNQ